MMVTGMKQDPNAHLRPQDPDTYFQAQAQPYHARGPTSFRTPVQQGPMSDLDPPPYPGPPMSATQRPAATQAQSRSPYPMEKGYGRTHGPMRPYLAPHASRYVHGYTAGPSNCFYQSQYGPQESSRPLPPPGAYRGPGFGQEADIPFLSLPNFAPLPRDAQLSSLPTLDFSARIKARFARSPGDPFSPPAPSFARHPPPRGAPVSSGAPLASYTHFQPFTCPPKGKLCGDGFEPFYPGAAVVDHEVSSADWEVSTARLSFNSPCRLAPLLTIDFRSLSLAHTALPRRHCRRRPANRCSTDHLQRSTDDDAPRSDRFFS